MATKPPSKHKRVRSVTLPVLKLEKNSARAVYVHGPMYQGEKVGKGDKEGATLLHAIDVDSGEEGLIIVPAVMRNELLKNYGAGKYVGKCFELTVTRDASKDYNHVGIDEIAMPEEFQRPTVPPHVAGAEIVTIPVRGEGESAPAGKGRR